MTIQKRVLTLSMLLTLVGSTTLMTPALADYYNRPYYDGPNYYGQNYYSQHPYYQGSVSNRIGNFFYNHPYIQKAAIAGGSGAILGGLIAPSGERSGGALKGALLGAGAGLGYQYLRNKGIINW